VTLRFISGSCLNPNISSFYLFIIFQEAQDIFGVEFDFDEFERFDEDEEYSDEDEEDEYLDEETEDDLVR
jgi:hypothetical protein